MTTNTDPNGISMSTLTGTRKQQVKTIAPLGATTTFTYDALGQLLQSTDPCNHSTTYTYDMLGRLVSRTHPDAGTDTYIYDGAGNMTRHATQILSNENKTIDYYYTYSRLDSVIYPDNPQNNVRYTYGDSTAGNNQRGRIALLEDASGFQTFKYGRMGEVIENNRTFVLPNERYPYSFKMKYTYDSWNRVQDITYPDGEVVYYKYNTGGMLDRVYGQAVVSNSVIIKGVIPGPSGPIVPSVPTTTYTYNYIDSIRYNEFELKSGQWYGNGTRSQYTYDILQRLRTLQLYNSGNSRLQNISYTYDRVGNITRIQNTAGMISSLGGEYNCRYSYDSLYRLVLATDTSYRGIKLAGRYEQLTSYFPDGRIQYKQDETWTYTSSFPFISNTYTYGNTNQPHTVTSTGNGINTPTTYTWDANGNMTKQGNNIVMQWDEENRLATYSRTGLGACYFYSADGERFYKNSGEKRIMLVNGSYYMTLPYYDSPVLYASPYVVATKDGYTKHYFVESERFASRIGDGKITNISSHATTSAILASKQATVNDAAPDSIAPNQFTFLRTLSARWSEHHTTFWQHPDHLGSASWVTDTNGRGYQHLQYRAWGETFIDQHVSGANYEARFTFSGKERDEESGFCYFGARPYNSELSLWLSVDPLSDKYPNLSPYTYCADNPVRLVDVDGREIWHPNGEGNLVADKGDNAWTLAEYLNTTPDMAKGMLKEQNYTINSDGILNLKVNDIFNVDYGLYRNNMNFIGTVGEIISSQSRLGLGEDIFRNYWLGLGDIELTGAQFAGILMYVKNNNPKTLDEYPVILRGASGKTYPGEGRVVDFYNSPYARTFGNATLYYNAKGNIVGFYDKYDFDSQPWGDRTIKNEIITRLVNSVSPKCSSPVNVRYGYSKR